MRKVLFRATIRLTITKLCIIHVISKISSCYEAPDFESMAHIPVTSLRSFLQTAKRALETLKPPFEDLTLVIGNESAGVPSLLVFS